MRALLAVLPLLPAAACSAVCPPTADCISNGAVVVLVVDAEAKAPLAQSTVLASSGAAASVEVPPCHFDPRHPGGTDAGPSNCRAIVAPGQYRLAVRAEGYAEATLDADSPKDACGHVTSQVREAGLHQLGSSAQPLVNSSEKCGG